MKQLAHFAITTMNYLFMQRCINSIDCSNKTIEAEIARFFEEFATNSFSPADFLFVKKLIVEVISEGIYLELYNPEELVELIHESLHDLMGYHEPALEDLYDNCVASACVANSYAPNIVSAIL